MDTGLITRGKQAGFAVVGRPQNLSRHKTAPLGNCSERCPLIRVFFAMLGHELLVVILISVVMD